MYGNDHSPPHFHAIYGEHEALYRIETLDLLVGALPKRAHALVIEWASMHREELIRNWERARVGENLKRIRPLE